MKLLNTVISAMVVVCVLIETTSPCRGNNLPALFGSSATYPQKPVLPGELFVKAKLKVPGDFLHGTLAVCVGKYIGIHPTYKLFYVPPSGEFVQGTFYPTVTKAVQIKSLRDLRGKVTINSEADALCFLRLATSPFTWELFENTTLRPIELEILWSPKSLRDICLGNDKWSRDVFETSYKNGYMAVIDITQAGELGLKAPEIKRVKNGFVVTRTLIRKTPKVENVYTIFEITEWVGKDGSVHSLKRTPLKLKSLPEIRWFILNGQGGM